MRFDLILSIDSGNQDVVDNPETTIANALNKAHDAAERIDYAECENSDNIALWDKNGNSIGFASIDYNNCNCED